MKRSLVFSNILILLALTACTPSESKIATPIVETELASPSETPTPSFTPSRTKTNTPTFTVTPSETPIAVGLVELQGANVVYYDISGSTERELREQLDVLGPVGSDNIRWDALTSWFIRWNWPGYGSNACNLSVVKVSYDIEVIFPRWISSENASSELIAKWVRYTQALAEHEKWHVDIVIASIQSVTDAIMGATCDTAEAAAQAALIPIRQQNASYDETTRHGAMQGARFP